MRKNQREGFRNRDSHFIEGIERNSSIQKILIVNRPFSVLELVYKRKSWKTAGKLVFKGLNYQVVQTNSNTFVLDYLSYDLLEVFKLKKAWFWKAYKQPGFVAILKDIIQKLNLKSYNVLAQNIFSYTLMQQLNADKIIFDADDNWLRFPFFQHLKNQVDISYDYYSSVANSWITNSEENKKFFADKYNFTNIDVIRNGVDKKKFEQEYPFPQDLINIPKPIIGFGGSISHLIDIILLKKLLEDHPDKSFVFIGPIINNSIYNSVKSYKNFIYLGDKHYNQYPAYIKNFDICFIPYHTGEKTHGGDAIKFYEFLAAGKKVVSSNGNGIYQANANIFLASDASEFSYLIPIALKSPIEAFELPKELTWDFKVNFLLSKFN